MLTTPPIKYQMSGKLDQELMDKATLSPSTIELEDMALCFTSITPSDSTGTNGLTRRALPSTSVMDLLEKVLSHSHQLTHQVEPSLKLKNIRKELNHIKFNMENLQKECQHLLSESQLLGIQFQLNADL